MWCELSKFRVFICGTFQVYLFIYCSYWQLSLRLWMRDSRYLHPFSRNNSNTFLKILWVLYVDRSELKWNDIKEVPWTLNFSVDEPWSEWVLFRIMYWNKCCDYGFIYVIRFWALMYVYVHYEEWITYLPPMLAFAVLEEQRACITPYGQTR